MLKKILNIIDYLELKNVGFLELLFAILPMLTGRFFMGTQVSYILWPILIVFAFFTPKINNSPKNNNPLLILAIYIVLHDFFFLLIGGNINALFHQIILFVGIFFVYPKLRMEKLVGSLNLIAVISIIGLLYQWQYVSAGIKVHPIDIPGFELPQDRLDREQLRPSSFFMEPASFVAFILVPVSLSLMRKKYFWTAIMILSVFLTTSTTGILISFVVLTVYLATQKVGVGASIVVVLLGVGMYLTLTRVSTFEFGMNKLENTDIEATRRIVDGPNAVGTMEAREFVVGAFYPNPYEYCKERARMVTFKDNNVFISTFWLMILKYGLIGLGLYLFVYWKLVKRSRLTLPLIFSLYTVLFSSGYGVGEVYAFTTIFLLSVVMNKKLFEK